MNREHGIGQTAATILKLLDITPGREMEGPHFTENTRRDFQSWRNGYSSV